MKIYRNIIFLTALLIPVSAWGVIPTVLTDTIRNGDGVIDVLNDASGAELEEYLQSGTLYLGVDLNEAASENESSTTSGVAIKEMELIITTTEGDFSFTEFYTNTTAMIQEDGGTGAEEYNTLFGSAGGSDITGSTSDFNLSAFDDVIILDNIEFSGEITGATLRVTFLDTAATGANETFFDYSAGFEEFAILSSTDAATLEAANIGLGDAAPTNITYSVDSPSGTPEPVWFILLILPAILLWRHHSRAKDSV